MEIRPWGNYEVLLEAQGHVVKRITVSPGKRLSLQRHMHRSEHWVVVSGKGEFRVRDETRYVGVGDTAFIGVGDVHRATGSEDSEFIFVEVQLGNILAEDDIVRLEDDYGR